MRKERLKRIGIFKENVTYTEDGKRQPYRPGDYTSHSKGEKLISYHLDGEKFTSAGDFRSSIIHKVPIEDLIWGSVEEPILIDIKEEERKLKSIQDTINKLKRTLKKISE